MINSLQQYLTEFPAKLSKLGCSNNVNGFNCLEAFVVKYGRNFPGPFQKTKRGVIKECFKNALDLSIREDLIYVEGYSFHILPILHAWCVDHAGRIYDPTWKEPGNEYFGVPFRTDFVLKIVLEAGCYGVIDRWEMGFPALKAEPKEFLYDINP